MSDTPRTDAASRITEYLGVGGLFNPEILNVQQHEAVRDTLIQARDELTAAQAEIARLKAGGCARNQRTTQFCAEALALQEENAKLRRALQRLVEARDDRSLEDFTAEELEAWSNAAAVLKDTK